VKSLRDDASSLGIESPQADLEEIRGKFVGDMRMRAINEDKQAQKEKSPGGNQKKGDSRVQGHFENVKKG